MDAAWPGANMESGSRGQGPSGIDGSWPETNNPDGTISFEFRKYVSQSQKNSWSFYLGHWFPARSHESGLDLGDEPAVHLGSRPGTTSNLPWSLARNQQSIFVLGHEPTIHLGSWPRTSNPRWPLTTHQQFTLVRGKHQQPTVVLGQEAATDFVLGPEASNPDIDQGVGGGQGGRKNGCGGVAYEEQWKQWSGGESGGRD